MNFGAMKPIERIETLEGMIRWMREHPNAEPELRVRMKRALLVAWEADGRATERESAQEFNAAMRRTLGPHWVPR